MPGLVLPMRLPQPGLAPMGLPQSGLLPMGLSMGLPPTCLLLLLGLPHHRLKISEAPRHCRLLLQQRRSTEAEAATWPTMPRGYWRAPER